ncbi:MAG: Brp/Blh family beta-carotene 15,15'-monooxygenase, partial [Gammaproteobacteria bacterium]
MKNYKIVITFFLLWLTIQFDYEAENILAYVSILTLGLLHGANDIKLLERKERSVKVNSFLVLLAYVGFVSIVGLLFYMIPVLALLLFVVLSGFHFGEEHLHGKYRLHSSLFTYFFTAYGLLILFLIFYFNATATSQIIYDITSYRVGSIFFLVGVLVSALGTLLCSIRLFKNKKTDVSYLEELVYILVFIIVFKMANLLWSFAIYFV